MKKVQREYNFATLKRVRLNYDYARLDEFLEIIEHLHGGSIDSDRVLKTAFNALRERARQLAGYDLCEKIFKGDYYDTAIYQIGWASVEDMYKPSDEAEDAAE